MEQILWYISFCASSKIRLKSVSMDAYFRDFVRVLYGAHFD